MATRKYTQHRNRMHPPPLIVILIVTKAGGGGGGFDTILYSQHATKIGSHTARGTITKHQTLTCVTQVLSSICFGKATRI